MTGRCRVRRGAVTVVGGAGFVGSAIARRATGSGRPVVSLDRVRQPPPRLPASVEQRMVDLLVDPIEMPPGPVVLAAGASDPHASDAWRLVLNNAVTTARLLPALADRQVVLVSSADDRKSTRLNSSHSSISYAVFCLK